MAVYVTRPKESITLNAGHREVLLDGDERPMVFENQEEAITYLAEHGIDDLCGIEFPEVPNDTRSTTTS